MGSLDQMKCDACRVGAPTVSDDEILTLLPQIPEWQVVEIDGVKKLQRLYSFSNFREALYFTARVGEMAEAEGHHPAILTEWGRTLITWWTHKIKGLHQNDFIAAAKTDTIYQATSTN